MYFLDLFGIGNAVEVAARRLVCGIAAIIYNTIVWVYDMFTAISTAKFLENDLVNSVFNKIGLLLGLFMVFKLIFTLIQSLIDPSKINDKKVGVGSILFRSIVAIVLLGVVRTIFNEAFKMQSLIVEGNGSNVIYKLIIGENSNNNNNNTSPGMQIASDLFFAFYRDDQDPKGLENFDPNDGFADPNEYRVDDIKAEIEDSSSGKDFRYTKKFIGYKAKANNENEKEFIIEFDWFYSIVFGVLILWILVTYCIQVAIRVFQLFFLELIAPIPILSYISDPDGSFKKWVKQCTSTYLDLFIRLAIIYFVMYLAPEITNFIDNSSNLISINFGNLGPVPKALTVGFLLVGLLLLGKRVPDLLKDLFPNLGGGATGLSFGISPKKFGEDLKTAWNMTPIGWAGKKAIGTIDRKIHHLPKQPGKIEQAFGKIAPGYAEAQKKRRQASIDYKERNKLNNEGQKLYEEYGSKLEKAFTGEYKESYKAVTDAKKANKKAESDYRLYLEQYQNAVKSGDQKVIEEASKALTTAEKNKNGANKALEEAKKRHEILQSQSRYKKYADQEKAYNFYNDTHFKAEEIDNPQLSSQNRVSSISSQNRVSSISSQNTNVSGPLYQTQEEWDKQISAANDRLNEIVEETGGDINSEAFQNQMNKIENLEKGKKSSAQLDDDLDDFYDRQNDGFGGQ